MIEIVGRLTTSPPHEGVTALFVVRSIAEGKLRAMRIVSVPESGAYSFYLQRASVHLEIGRIVLRYFARPVLWITAFSLPVGLLVYLLAPLWLAVRRRRDAAPSTSVPSSFIPSRREAFLRVSPGTSAIATFAAGLAAAAPAAVAIASLWA